MKSTALTLPGNKLVPPPNKAEVIAALVERARAQWKTKHDARVARITQIKEELQQMASKVLLKDVKTLHRCYEFHTWPSSRYVRIEIDIGTPEIKTKMAELAKLMETREVFDEKETRKYITEQMGADRASRVQALLADPVAVKALDAVLQKIDPS